MRTKLLLILAAAGIAYGTWRLLPSHSASAKEICKDFVTGGGFFEPRFEGGPTGRVNFGFNAGVRSPRDPTLRGHFNLVDHNDGTHVSGYNVREYFPCANDDVLCRRFIGDATLNGEGGYTYEVSVCDYGEPGRDDRIRVMVFEGQKMVYFADDSDSVQGCDRGEDNCGDLDGGNIQLHRFCTECEYR